MIIVLCLWGINLIGLRSNGHSDSVMCIIKMRMFNDAYIFLLFIEFGNWKYDWSLSAPLPSQWGQRGGVGQMEQSWGHAVWISAKISRSRLLAAGTCTALNTGNVLRNGNQVLSSHNEGNFWGETTVIILLCMCISNHPVVHLECIYSLLKMCFRKKKEHKVYRG